MPYILIRERLPVPVQDKGVGEGFDVGEGFVLRRAFVLKKEGTVLESGKPVEFPPTRTSLRLKQRKK